MIEVINSSLLSFLSLSPPLQQDAFRYNMSRGEWEKKEAARKAQRLADVAAEIALLAEMHGMDS